MPEKRTALAVQAAYYIATGGLPFVSRRAFESLTGPKRDWWLVQMVGLLAITTGATIAVGLRNRARVCDEIIVLSVLSAASFAAIDVAYALRRTISTVYLVDAALECALIAALGLTRR